MQIPIPAPQRLAPTQTLFAAAQTGAGGDRWGDGVVFPSDCGEAGLVVPICGDPDGVPLDGLDSAGEVDARTFLVWAGRRCSTIGGGNDSETAAVAEAARAALEIDRHRQLEYEFWTGTLARAEGWAGQPYLTNTATLEVVDSTGLPVALGYGELAAALADCSVGRGLIHVSRRVMTALVAGGLVRREGTQWRDPFDNLVVGAAGYTGQAPVDDEDEPLDGVGEWMFATGPVEARFGDVFITGDTPGEIDRDTNTREVRAQQFAGAWFDPCCHLAVTVDLCASDCPTSP